MRLIKQLSLFTALAFPLLALAHNGVEHLMGTVKVVNDAGLTLETTDKKEVRVTFDASTKFEKDGTPASAKELSPGARVAVNAKKKQGTSELVAVLVKLGSKSSDHADAEHHAARSVALSVTEQGFAPDRVKLKKDEPVDLVITRKTDTTCAKAISIPDYGITRELPLNQAVTVRLTPKRTGEIKYGCAMEMMVGGVLTVE